MLLLDDKEILKLFNQGGVFANKAFANIVKQYSEQTYWQIRRQTKNHEDSNDILQNTLLKTFKGLSNFKGDSVLSTWIFSIARNETYTFLEKRNKKEHRELDAPHIQLTHFTEELVGLDATKIEEILQRAIAALPAKQAQVFELKYFEDMKYNEISKLVNTSVGGLKASYHHAVQKIKEFVVKELNH